MVANSSRVICKARAQNEARKTNTERKPKQNDQDHRCSRVVLLGGVYVALEFLLYHLLCLILVHGIESSHTNRIEHAEHRKHSNTFFRRWLRTDDWSVYLYARDARTVSHAHLKPNARRERYPSLSAIDRHRPQHIQLPSCIAQPRPDTIHSNLLPLAYRCRRTETRAR